MNTANQQTPSTCPICHSTICCCLEHLFPGDSPPPGRGLGRLPESAPPSVQAPAPVEEAPPTRLELPKDEAYALAVDLAKRAAPGHTPQEGQTKRASLLEAFANILIGFWVSVLANMLVLPHFKNPGVFREAFLIGLIFTVISFARSYLLRRLFNLFHLRTNRRSPWKP